MDKLRAAPQLQYRGSSPLRLLAALQQSRQARVRNKRSIGRADWGEREAAVAAAAAVLQCWRWVALQQRTTIQ